MAELNSLDRNHLSSETSHINSWKEERNSLHDSSPPSALNTLTLSTLISSFISFANMLQGFSHVQLLKMLLLLEN